MERTTVESNTEWEEVVGYSRAVRVGPSISVSGTTATDADGEIGGGSAYEQATRAIANVERALREAGGELGDIVRARMYVTDIDDWEQVAEAHREAFDEIRPATTMIEVRRLIAPELVVEIDADAILTETHTDAGKDADDADDADSANNAHDEGD